jgi:hypothetical protein
MLPFYSLYTTSSLMFPDYKFDKLASTSTPSTYMYMHVMYYYVKSNDGIYPLTSSNHNSMDPGICIVDQLASRRVHQSHAP